MMLFASVGTLEHTEVTKVIAERLVHGVGSRPFWMINIVGWATGWLERVSGQRAGGGDVHAGRPRRPRQRRGGRIPKRFTG